MTIAEIKFTKSDYCRMWGTYWIFCLRTRYNKTLLIKLAGAFVIAATLLTLAHPETIFYPVLVLLGIILCAIPVIIAFEYFKYRRYLNRISKIYDEEQERINYKLSFDESRLFYFDKEIRWSNYKFYYIEKQHIYIFKNRYHLALIWSVNSMDTDAFVNLISCTKANLKILPAARGIIFKQ